MSFYRDRINTFSNYESRNWAFLEIGIMSEEIRLHEGELNVMELLWSNRERELAAKDIAAIIKEYIGWEKNTTYTVINRLIDKGAIKREEPGFLCSALISKQQVQEIETQALFDKVYNGSIINFFNEYLKYRQLKPNEIIELEKILSEKKTFRY